MIKQAASLTISNDTAWNIIRRSWYGQPYECCGLVLSSGEVVQYPNTYDGDRCHAFSMDVDIKGLDVHAVWHSHPTGPLKPSAEDESVMGIMFEQGYAWSHIIAVPDYIKTDGIAEFLVVNHDITSPEGK